MKRTLAQNISWQTLGDAITNILGFVFYVVLARMLGQSGLGLYSYIFSIMAFVSLALNFGYSSYYFRKWSGRQDTLKEDLWAIFLSRSFLAIPMSLGLLGYIFFLDRYASLEFLLAYIAILLELIVGVLLVFYNSQNAFHRSFQINILDKVCSQGLGLVFLHNGFSLRYVLLAFILGKVAALLSAGSFWRHFKVGPFTFSLIYKSFKEVTGVFLYQFFNVLYFKIDVIVMRYVLSLTQVGVYSASYRLFETLQVIPGILIISLTPALVVLHREKSWEKRSDLVNLVLTGLFFLASFACVFFGFYGVDILMFLYGPEYLAATPALRWLGGALVLLFGNSFLSQVLYSQHEEKYLSQVVVVLTGVNVLANATLLPLLGITGAGVVTFVCECVKLCALAWKLRSHVSISWFIQVSHLFVALGVIGALSLSQFPWPAVFVLAGMVYTLFEGILHWKRLRTFFSL